MLVPNLNLSIPREAMAQINCCLKGIEKETLRVDRSGSIASTPHPTYLGSALTHPYITTDYSEALLELVTPPYQTALALEKFLSHLHHYVYQGIGNEKLWIMSMPYFSEVPKNIPIAQYGNSAKGLYKTIYRRGLSKRYGEAMQAIAGVHFNFSFSEQFFQSFFGEDSQQDKVTDFYLNLARNFKRYSFVLLYLFGASPIVSKHYKNLKGDEYKLISNSMLISNHATSLRMSNIGYTNSSNSQIYCSLNSIDNYISDLTAALTQDDPVFKDLGGREDLEQINYKRLQIENEYYSNVRPKPSGQFSMRPLLALKKYGVHYVEIRSLDLNPYSEIGISKEQLHFIEAFLIFCAFCENKPIQSGELDEIQHRDLEVALYGRRKDMQVIFNGQLVNLHALIKEIMHSVEKTIDAFELKDLQKSFEYWTLRFEEKFSLSQELYDALVKEKSIIDWVLEKSDHYKEKLASYDLDDSMKDSFSMLVRSSIAEQKQIEEKKISIFDYIKEQELE